MAKRQPSFLRMPENGAGDPFFGRQGNWFEVIFESSYDGIYITDGSAITLTLNKSYETISGLRKEEMVGRSMAELVENRVVSASGTLLALERRESVTMEQQFKPANGPSSPAPPFLMPKAISSWWSPMSVTSPSFTP